MLHAPTIDFRIILYMPYSEQSRQCPSTDNIENSPPPPDFLIPCTNEVQLNRFWKPINDRSWGRRGCIPLLSPGIFRLFMVFCCEFHSNNIHLVVNFLSQVIFVFVLLLGMVMYANEVEIKEI